MWRGFQAAWFRPGEAEGELAEAYDRIGARDPVANVIGLHSLHPRAEELE